MSLLINYRDFLELREYTNPDEYSEREKRLIFFVDDVLELTTYCDAYSLGIGEYILDVMKSIYHRHNTNDSLINYKEEDNEYLYILYVQFIIQYLEWGTSIWSAWFDSSKEICGYKLNSQNVKLLISWLDGKK